MRTSRTNEELRLRVKKMVDGKGIWAWSPFSMGNAPWFL
jgi:hypothetical protein